MTAPTPLAAATWRTASASAVAQIHARRGGAIPPEERAHPDARLGIEITLGASGPFRRRRRRRSRLQRPQTRGRGADRAGEIQLVARPRAAARHRPARLHGADRRHVENERTGRARDVAAGQVHAVARGERGQAADDGVEVVERQRRGQHERQERDARRRAHRREVAQVHGERAVADRLGRREPPVEVHAFDDRVHRQHVEAVPLRRHDRRIVADADDHPARRGRQRGADARDERRLGDVADDGA